MYGRAGLYIGDDSGGAPNPNGDQFWSEAPGAAPAPAQEPAIELRWPPAAVQAHSGWRTAWMVAATASMAACVYHGYKRNESIGWALGWGLFGSVAPVVAPAIALAQGFGKPKGR